MFWWVGFEKSNASLSASVLEFADVKKVGADAGDALNLLKCAAEVGKNTPQLD
jgi:hypothetical protein